MSGLFNQVAQSFRKREFWAYSSWLDIVTRYRRTLTQERSREIQRLDKVLQDAQIKLTSVVSTLQTKTARAILAALVSGVEDPAVLAELAQGRLKDRKAELAAVMSGRFRRDHHGLLVGQILTHVDFLDGQIEQLDDRLEVLFAPFGDLPELVATIPGVEDRDAADALRGAELFVPRAALPPPAAGEYYWVDLEGLRVVNTQGADFGVVSHLFSTGANDVLVARGDRERMIPFVTPDYVVSVDFEAGLVTVDWDPEF